MSSSSPTPGASAPCSAAKASLATQLAVSCGKLADEIVVVSGPLEPIADDVTEMATGMSSARDWEWGLTADDILRGRTTFALSGRDSDAVRARAETLLAS